MKVVAKEEKLKYLKSGYTKGKRRQDLTTVTLWAIFWAYHFCDVALHMSLSHIPAMLLGIFLAMVGADFLSGMIHWACDTWGSVDGSFGWLIRSFREHHVDAKAMTHHDFFEVTGSTSLVAAPITLYLAYSFQSSLFEQASFWGATQVFFTLYLFLFAVITNQVHKWAHMPLSAPRIVQVLQRYHLLLNPRDHKKHHTNPFDCYFTIFNGWLNEPFAMIGFWTGLEWIITTITGVPPRVDDQSWRKDADKVGNVAKVKPIENSHYSI